MDAAVSGIRYQELLGRGRVADHRQCAWNGSTRAGNSAQAAYLSVGVPGENLKVTVKDSGVSSLQPLLLEFAVQVYHHQI